MREMKNSGVAWIGDIPEEYSVVAVKNMFEIGRGRVIAKTELCDAGYPVYSSQTKNDGCLGYINTYDFDRDQLTWTTDGANAGTIFLRRGKHNCTNICGTLLPKSNDICLEYQRYALWYIALHHKRADTNGFKIMNNEMAAIKTVVPPPNEQRRIAVLLDEKSTQIDTLIANQEAQIEKLKQYKQSLITEVVTKGLNPDVEMKDSGVEWIGDIAVNHSIWKLKFLLSKPMLYGANESGEPQSENSVRYIRITDITSDSKLKDNDDNLYLSVDKAEAYILEDGDVLFARSGGTVGKTFIYKAEYGRSAFAGYLIKASCNITKLLPEYLFYYTQSSLYEIWKNMIFIQATIQNIGANKYSNMEMVIMDISKQKDIVSYLDEQCSKIDKLIEIKQSKITKLNEYKKSLIYEYVTGKKEVC